MFEKMIEKKLVQAIRTLGGTALKFVSPGFDGMPDRIILMQGGRAAFAEIKAPGRKPRPLQLARHEMLRRLGFNVYVIDSMEAIGEIVNGI